LADHLERIEPPSLGHQGNLMPYEYEIGLAVLTS
jgi:hypothetical protein